MKIKEKEVRLKDSRKVLLKSAAPEHAEAIQRHRYTGFEQVELGVFEDNTKAIHLYEKHGFCKVGLCPMPLN